MAYPDTDLPMGGIGRQRPRISMADTDNKDFLSGFIQTLARGLVLPTSAAYSSHSMDLTVNDVLDLGIWPYLFLHARDLELNAKVDKTGETGCASKLIIRDLYKHASKTIMCKFVYKRLQLRL